MKLLILFWLFSSAYCSESYGQDRVENKERRIAGGGNYGGFIGLTTYGGGPFLVKGKFEKDDKDNGKGDKDSDSKYNDKNAEPKYIGDIGYEDSQKDQLYKKEPFGYYEKKDEDEYLEYLGYRDARGYEDSQKDQLYKKEPFGYYEKKDEDEYLEYLGYRDARGYCIGEYRDKDGYDNRYSSEYRRNRLNNSDNYYDDRVKNKCDKLFGFTGPTANDEPDNLIRPCALDDWQCIRSYFAANSNCKPAYGPIPDPLYIDINTAFYPVVNLTIALPNVMIRGLSSAKIREFYVNKKSRNLVLALDVTNLNETVRRAYFRYRRTAKESIVLADFATINYRAITLTAVIPYAPHLRLDLADIHPDIQDPLPPFLIGPGAANSTDPDVITAFAQFNLLVPIVIREGLFFQSQLFTAIYIQKNICDFGLKLISV